MLLDKSIIQFKEGKEDNEFWDKIGPDLPAELGDWFLHEEPEVEVTPRPHQDETEDYPAHHSSRICRTDRLHLHPGIREPLRSGAFNIHY